ncbi:MAG: DUF58 domain-containing protein [Anaerovoracaceae bacterium]|jgi:uncharacterized protein (DUF58 family)
MKISSIRKIIFCALLIVVAAIPAIFINTIFGYLPVFVIALLIGGSYLYLLGLRRTLEFQEMSDLSNCVRGSRIDFTVELRNRFLLFFPRVEPFFYISDLFGDEDTVTSDIVTLTPREDRRFSFDVRFDHIGTYSAGLRKVVIQDLLGLFSKTIENNEQYTVSVTPKIYDVAQLPISRTAVTESDKMLVPNPMDSTDYNGVREYVIGDPIKNIHWKISARTDSYMTKLYESYTNTGICIILDFQSPEYDPETMMSIFDSVVETGLSIGTYAVDNGLESEVTYYDKYGEKIKFSTYARDSFVSIVESMPKIHSGEKADVSLDILREEGNALYSQGNIAICTANITYDLVETLVGVKNRRKNPMLFAIVPDKLTDDERAEFVKPLHALDDARISYHILGSAEDLEGGRKS